MLTPEILAKLRKLHSDQAKARLPLGEAWEDHELIFPSEVGTPPDPDNFSHTGMRALPSQDGGDDSGRAA